MTIVGVDFGERRIGIAVSDPGCVFALPVAVEEVDSPDEAICRIVRICVERAADRLVVGMPLSMRGEKGTMALRVEAVCERLRQLISVPIIPWDERLSTVAAERVLRDASRSERQQRHARDKIAAQLILQGYLDSLPHNDAMDYPS